MANTKITSHVIEANAILSTHIASGAITSGHLSNITSDNVSEGSTNVYHTAARARGTISVTGGNLAYDSSTGVLQLTDAEIRDAISATSSGDGSLTYTSSTGVIAYTGPTASQVQAHLSAGTGVTYSSGAISIGQAVGTSDTVVFGNITTAGYLRGPTNFTIDPAGHGDNTGTLIVAGNLQVDGTTTTINSTTLTVDDLNITLASGAANGAAANGAGITVDGASATLLYASSGDKFVFNKGLDVGAITTTGNLTLSSTTPILNVLAASNEDATLILREDGSGIVGAQLIYDGGANEFQFKIGNNSANTAFTIARDTGRTTFAQTTTIQSDSGNEQLVIKRQSAQNEQLIFGFHSSDYATIQAVEQGVAYRPIVLNGAGGNVGIGTTSPGHKLDVEGGANVFDLARFGSSASDNSEITIGYFDANANNGIPAVITASDFGGLIQGGENGHLVLGIRDNDATDALDIVSGGGNFMTDTTYDTLVATFKANGNVGIGINNPSQIFHVQKAADDKLVYGSNPRLLLDTPTGINGLRVLGDTTPFEFKIDSGTYNGSTFQMGGTGDLSFIGTTTTASDTFNDSPTFFFNSQRWNGSANSTHFQGAIKGHTRSATNGDGYLGIGANASANHLNIDASTGNVGIRTTDPKANLHVNVTGNSDGFLAGGKNLSLNASYQTGAQLEVTLGNHQGCYVKVFITGDWSGHSAMAFLGEYFIQNGANAYAEPGMIIREVENTNGIDSISSRIYDGGNYDSFQIQFKLNVPSGGVTSAAGNLTYQIMGQFDAVS